MNFNLIFFGLIFYIWHFSYTVILFIFIFLYFLFRINDQVNRLYLLIISYVIISNLILIHLLIIILVILYICIGIYRFDVIC